MQSGKPRGLVGGYAPDELTFKTRIGKHRDCVYSVYFLVDSTSLCGLSNKLQILIFSLLDTDILHLYITMLEPTYLGFPVYSTKWKCWLVHDNQCEWNVPLPWMRFSELFVDCFCQWYNHQHTSSCYVKTGHVTHYVNRHRKCDQLSYQFVTQFCYAKLWYCEFCLFGIISTWIFCYSYALGIEFSFDFNSAKYT